MNCAALPELAVPPFVEVHSKQGLFGLHGAPVFFHGYGRYVCREAQVTLDEFEESDERMRARTKEAKPPRPKQQNKQAHPNNPPKETENGAGSYPLEVLPLFFHNIALGEKPNPGRERQLSARLESIIFSISAPPRSFLAHSYQLA